MIWKTLKIFNQKWKFRWKWRNKHEKKLMKYPPYRINKKNSKDKELKKDNYNNSTNKEQKWKNRKIKK